MNRPTILVIEDNEQNLYLMRFLLEKQGFRVLSAMDGREGLEQARQSVPAAILLDIQLPGMDGHAVAAALRRDPRLDRIPIIAVTSYAMPGDREKCLASGATAYIEKPIDPATFVEQIRQHLGMGAKDDSGADEGHKLSEGGRP
jgi:two-component system, cell cycle response regulator DivK